MAINMSDHRSCSLTWAAQPAPPSLLVAAAPGPRHLASRGRGKELAGRWSAERCGGQRASRVGQGPRLLAWEPASCSVSLSLEPPRPPRARAHLRREDSGRVRRLEQSPTRTHRWRELQGGVDDDCSDAVDHRPGNPEGDDRPRQFQPPRGAAGTGTPLDHRGASPRVAACQGCGPTGGAPGDAAARPHPEVRNKEGV